MADDARAGKAPDKGPDTGPDKGPAATEELRPFDPPEGSGQNLPGHELSAAQAAQKLRELREQNEKKAKKTEIELMHQVREDHANAQRERREKAVAGVRSSRDEIAETRESFRSIPMDAASLALEAAFNAQLAEALEQDETVPGGAYIVEGRLMDANGRDLGPAPKS